MTCGMKFHTELKLEIEITIENSDTVAHPAGNKSACTHYLKKRKRDSSTVFKWTISVKLARVKVKSNTLTNNYQR